MASTTEGATVVYDGAELGEEEKALRKLAMVEKTLDFDVAMDTDEVAIDTVEVVIDILDVEGVFAYSEEGGLCTRSVPLAE